ncbi:hypothetical protein TNCV_2368281 [Trichonephila clavipes]|nr:hypothetical protein TNCV_2368281 [Trichonephila clavipes]
MNHATPNFALMEHVKFGENPTQPRIHLALLALCKGVVGLSRYEASSAGMEVVPWYSLRIKKAVMIYLDILVDQVHPAMLHFYPNNDRYFMANNATIHQPRNDQN